MKILIVDDHPLFLEGIRPLLSKLADTVELIDAHTQEQAIEIIQGNAKFDLILLDLNLPEVKGHSLLESVRAQQADTPIVMLTASTRRSDMQAALALGAKGYICKSASAAVVLNALNLILAGGVYIPPEMVQDPSTGNFSAAEQKTIETPNSKIKLTPRQLEVLRLLVDGKGRSNKEIANQIGCSEATIKVHVTAILKALHVTNRSQLQTAVENSGVLIPERRLN